MTDKNRVSLNQWMYAIRESGQPDRPRWKVLTIDGDSEVGEIRWEARWNHYAFFPTYTGGYTENCLKPIRELCRKLDLQEQGVRIT